MIAARPTGLPYNDTVKWIVDHANPKDRSFNTSTGLLLANFRSEIFVKIYTLKPFMQLLNADFVKDAKSRYNFDQMLKYWMAERRKFSQIKDELYPIEWFNEPFSLLAAMLCRLYSLPNWSYFKEEWASISHHVITTGKSLPWASILSLELNIAIQEF